MLLGVSALPAQAATVGVDAKGVAVYSAAPGEANQLRVVLAGDQPVVFEDDGAEITAADGCTSVSSHLVSCAGFEDIAVALGDGEDTVEVTGQGPSAAMTPHFDGGPGNDQLTGSDHADEMNGGLGDDVVDGAAAGDVVNGGGGGTDEIRAGDQFPPEPDVLIDGDSDASYNGDAYLGHHNSIVSYESRSRSLDVQLREENGGGGANGERDIYVGAIRSARGGTGDDRLTASFRGSSIFGGPGDDQVYGADSGDFLAGGGGADRIFGGGGGDRIDPGEDDARDVVRCGTFTDSVIAHDARDVLRATCEKATWFSRPFADPEHLIGILPEVREGRLAFSATCGARSACAGTIALRAPKTRLLLGRGRFSVPSGGSDGTIEAVLNERGRRRLRRGGYMRVVFARAACRRCAEEDRYSGFTTFIGGRGPGATPPSRG